MNDDFYVTLSSNAGGKYYPNNTLTHFWNKCAEPIELGDPTSWKVGLVDIQFPVNWDRLPAKEQAVHYLGEQRIEGVDGGEARLEQVTFDFVLQPVDFRDASALVHKIKTATKMHPYFKTAVNIFYNQTFRTIRIELPPRTAMVTTSTVLSVLGIKGGGKAGHVLGNKRDDAAVYEGSVDVNVRFRTLWIYSDVCAHRMVGDTRAPLLRTVPIVAADGTLRQMYAVYEVPLYAPVSRNYFPAIELLITDTAGERIPFRAGQVVATLHFVKKKA